MNKEPFEELTVLDHSNNEPVSYSDPHCTLLRVYSFPIVMAPPGQTATGLMIYIHSTVEIDIDIEVIKAKIKLIKDKIAERIIFRSRVKWHEEGEKNNAYFLGLMNSKYTRLDLHKVTDEEGTATDKKLR